MHMAIYEIPCWNLTHFAVNLWLHSILVSIYLFAVNWQQTILLSDWPLGINSPSIWLSSVNLLSISSFAVRWVTADHYEVNLPFLPSIYCQFKFLLSIECQIDILTSEKWQRAVNLIFWHQFRQAAVNLWSIWFFAVNLVQCYSFDSRKSNWQQIDSKMLNCLYDGPLSLFWWQNTYLTLN